LWLSAAAGAHGLALGLAISGGLGLVGSWLALQRTLAHPLSSSFGLGLAGILVVGVAFTLGLPMEWPWQGRLLASACAMAVALAAAALLSGHVRPPASRDSTFHVARPIIR
jgi:hypothetical protein